MRPAQQRLVVLRQPAQLRDGRAQVRGDAGVGEVLGRQHLRAAAVRRGPDRVGLRLERGQQRAGAVRGRRGERVERRERRPAPGATPRPRAPRGRRAARRGARAARARRRAPDRRGTPGVRSHVSRSPALPPGSAARAPASTPAPSRVRSSGDAAVVADRDAVAGQHLGEQRGRRRVAAQQHRDVARLDPLPHQLQHLGADELGLGALPARLEQPHGAVRRLPHRSGLEQRALEVVQRRPRRRGVVARTAPAAARPSASGRSSSTVAARPANATRPGSYGSATSTSTPACRTSVSTASRWIGVRSSNPYRNTGRPPHAPGSARSASSAAHA